MGHDDIHDGGVTEPRSRTFGWVPKARERGNGASPQPLSARYVRGTHPHLHLSRGYHHSSPTVRHATGCCVGWSPRHVASVAHCTAAMIPATHSRPLDCRRRFKIIGDYGPNLLQRATSTCLLGVFYSVCASISGNQPAAATCAHTHGKRFQL
jgi:hypothetical protein